MVCLVLPSTVPLPISIISWPERCEKASRGSRRWRRAFWEALHEARGEKKKDCGWSVLDLHCVTRQKWQRGGKAKQLQRGPGTQSRHLLALGTARGMRPPACPAPEDLDTGNKKNGTKRPSTQLICCCTELTCLRIKRKEGKKWHGTDQKAC